MVSSCVKYLFHATLFLVYDASAKLSSGVLNGNVNQYGDFDQCLDTVAKTHNFKSQYCLAHIQPRVASDYKYFNYLRTLSLSFEAYKSKFEDVSTQLKYIGEVLLRNCANIIIDFLSFVLSFVLAEPRYSKNIADTLGWVTSFRAFTLRINLLLMSTQLKPSKQWIMMLFNFDLIIKSCWQNSVNVTC